MKILLFNMLSNLNFQAPLPIPMSSSEILTPSIHFELTDLGKSFTLESQHGFKNLNWSLKTRPLTFQKIRKFFEAKAFFKANIKHWFLTLSVCPRWDTSSAIQQILSQLYLLIFTFVFCWQPVLHCSLSAINRPFKMDVWISGTELSDILIL